MAVSITWSSSDNGVGISSVGHGSVANGANTTAQTIFVRHDGLDEITGMAFYFAQKSGNYAGDATAADDFLEMKEWGDANTESTFGGIQMNMDAINLYTGGPTWGLSHLLKESADGLKFNVTTDKGSSLATQFTAVKEMSASMVTNGVLPNGVTDASFKMRVVVPAAETQVGIRQFDQILKYTFTS